MIPDASIITSPHNYNSELWVALAVMNIQSYQPTPRGACVTILRMVHKLLQTANKWKDIIVLEYGVDYAWEMEKELWIVRPDIAVYTATDKVHALQFGDAQSVLKEDVRLLTAAKEIICIPQQEREILAEHIASYAWDKFVYTWKEQELDTSREWQDSTQWLWRHVTKQYVNDGLPYVEMVSSVYGQQYTTKVQFMWQENLWYISLGYLLTRLLWQRVWYSTKLYDKWVFTLSLQLQPWRWTLVKGRWGAICIDSSYNASPNSMRATIENVERLRDTFFPWRPVRYCLGDMRELWQYTDQEHIMLWWFIADRMHGQDRLYLVWDTMRRIVKPSLEHTQWLTMQESTENAENALHCYDTSREAWQQLLDDLKWNQWIPPIILAKWSQNTLYLEELLLPLLDPPSQANLLPRQSTWRRKKKEKFFTSKKKTMQKTIKTMILGMAVGLGNALAGCSIQPTDGIALQPTDEVSEYYSGALVCYEEQCKRLEIASTMQERSYGLMNRTELPTDGGMIFLFPQPGVYKFRMKNTLISLDIVRLNENKQIIYQSLDTPPCPWDPCPLYWPESEALYVIELAAWEAQKRWITSWAQLNRWTLPPAR